MEEPDSLSQILTPSSSGGRSCGVSNSPEFEFWMVRNPNFPQPDLLSADELFSDGVILPLHHLRLENETPPPPPREPETSATESAELSATSALTSSKRWRDIFIKIDRKSSQANVDDIRGAKEKDNRVNKDKRREKKNGAGPTTAELNINIWPFSRSRSAGNSGTRPRSASSTRKVSSAPCSRSNSRGESKSRKWPSSPSRAGVHVGKSSPVWQVRRRSAEAVAKNDGNEGRRKIPVAGAAKARVLNLNVPMCIGYRQHLSCRGDENSGGDVVAGFAGGGQNGGGISGEGVRGSNFLNIKSLFTKKIY